MPVVGIGVDLVHVPRIAALIYRRGTTRVASRILSKTELQEFETYLEDKCKFIAVRYDEYLVSSVFSYSSHIFSSFSVKEAAYKAVYPNAKPTWKDFTYCGLGHSHPGSKPLLLFKPTEEMPLTSQWKFHVSVSHDGDFVMSSVVVES